MNDFSDCDGETTDQRVEYDQADGTSLVLNAGYLDQQEKTDCRVQRAATEDSTDTGKSYSLYFGIKNVQSSIPIVYIRFTILFYYYYYYKD